MQRPSGGGFVAFIGPFCNPWGWRASQRSAPTVPSYPSLLGLFHAGVIARTIVLYALEV